jgi:hypothetical protein
LSSGGSATFIDVESGGWPHVYTLPDAVGAKPGIVNTTPEITFIIKIVVL